MSALLPVHGFVLAGGKSSRMGEDKAQLMVGSRTMIEIAVARLHKICATVSIAGNRADLAGTAGIAAEHRAAVGPVAGIEAGLLAARHPWAMFTPIDAPLVPPSILRAWLTAVLEQQDAGCGESFLVVNGHREPAFCAVRSAYVQVASRLVDQGERRIANLLQALHEDGSHGWLWPVDVARFAPEATAHQQATWFMNVNTPQDLIEANASFQRLASSSDVIQQ